MLGSGLSFRRWKSDSARPRAGPGHIVFVTEPKFKIAVYARHTCTIIYVGRYTLG